MKSKQIKRRKITYPPSSLYPTTNIKSYYFTIISQEQDKFESLNINVRDIETIRKIMDKKDLLINQNLFEKNIYLNNLKPEIEKIILSDFRVNVEDIDRLYYINSEEEKNFFSFNMIARQKYKGVIPLYVEMTAAIADNLLKGTIFISNNALVFMSRVLQRNTRANKYLIYELLWRDNNNIYNLLDTYEKTTHPNFKSLDPNIQNIKDIEKILKVPLHYQYILEKHTTPFEMQKDWNNNNELLQQFRITVEDIDRLYCIKHNLYENSMYIDIYNLIIRMQYEGKPIYVELCFISDYGNKFGKIYVSRNANIFMNVVLRQYKDINKNLIYNSLLNDDHVYVEEYTDNNTFNTSLYGICHKIIYKNKDIFHKMYKFQLPKKIKESIDEFIETMTAKKEYDEKYNEMDLFYKNRKRKCFIFIDFLE